jgi:hypothetical protein
LLYILTTEKIPKSFLLKKMKNYRHIYFRIFFSFVSIIVTKLEKKGISQDFFGFSQNGHL